MGWGEKKLSAAADNISSCYRALVPAVIRPSSTSVQSGLCSDTILYSEAMLKIMPKSGLCHSSLFSTGFWRPSISLFHLFKDIEQTLYHFCFNHMSFRVLDSIPDSWLCDARCELISWCSVSWSMKISFQY